MKKYAVLLFVPVAFACTKQKNTETTKANLNGTEIVSAALAPPKAQQILGVVQFQEACAEKSIRSECLAVIGGDDLTESRTFYLPGGDNSAYERVPSNGENKKFRIKMPGQTPSSMEVTENQHIALLAQLDSPTSEGNQRIAELQAVHAVEK